MNDPRRLPVIRLNGRNYFVDLNLEQIRNVNNPNDFKNIARNVLECLLKEK